MKMCGQFLFLIIVLALIVAGCTNPTGLTPIRIGWQTTWATQGQITQTLKHTNVLTKNGLEGTFVGVSYGAPLNEAALAGDVDVIFTADQPAAALLARGANWVIIGRLMFNRVAIYVPPESPIQDLADLKGKRIPMPFGAAAQRVAFKAIADAGLDPTKDITAINLDITEQAGIVERGTSSSWGDVDAMAGFDPTVAILETSKAARMLHIGRVTSVIVMSKDYIAAHPDAPVRFLQAFKEAVLYYAKHVKQANDWFRQTSQLTFNDEVLALAASVEPNLQAETISDVSITFTPDLITGMQEAADFLFDNGLISQQVQIANHIDRSYAEKANAELAAIDYNPNSVQAVEKNK
jgi:ABC-type nitrate/sulfonate/bicarbonate transport system substrate-binding protein